MKKIIAAIIITIILAFTFIWSSSYIVGKVDNSIELTQKATDYIEKDDYASAIKILEELKEEMASTVPNIEKLLVHQSIEEVMRSVDEALVYCKYQIKSEAVKELVGAKYLLNNIRDLEVLSLKSIF